nr:XdhC family protein [Actinomycetota bacterium]
LAEQLSEPALKRLRVPAGLNLGGKAPGEIALSVVAEIVADGHGRDGRPLRVDR